MKTKHIYTVPECEQLFVWENSPLCVSTALEPLIESTDPIVWDD